MLRSATVATLAALACVISRHTTATSALCERRADPGDCCVPGSFNLSLANSSVNDAREVLPGVELQEYHESRDAASIDCSHSALFRVRFQPLDNDSGSCSRCLGRPACGRRMLRVDVDIADVDWMTNWVLEIGEAAYDREHAGNAWIVISAHYVDIRTSRLCHLHSGTLNFTMSSVRRLSVFVSHHHLRLFSRTTGQDKTFCSQCLFHLTGERDGDRQPVRDSVIYVGINQGVHRLGLPYYQGYGICSARLSWACPWCYDMEEARETSRTSPRR